MAAAEPVRVAPRPVAIDRDGHAQREAGAAAEVGQSRLDGHRVSGPAEAAAAADDVVGGDALQAAAHAAGERAALHLEGGGQPHPRQVLVA